MGRGHPDGRAQLAPAARPETRVGLYIDGKNFYRAMREYDAELELDYARFAQWLSRTAAGAEEARLVGAFYCTGYAEHDPVSDTPQIGRSFDTFLTRLAETPGYTVRREPRVRRSRACSHCGKVNDFSAEKRVDTRLVAELVRAGAADEIDIAVLLSGDADFVPAVDVLIALGKRVLVASWPGQAIAADLRAACAGAVLDLAAGTAEYIAARAVRSDTAMAAAFAQAGVFTPAQFARRTSVPGQG